VISTYLLTFISAGIAVRGAGGRVGQGTGEDSITRDDFTFVEIQKAKILIMITMTMFSTLYNYLQHIFSTHIPMNSQNYLPYL
jgi:hypothetical protein